MLFNSYEFIFFFLPITLIGFHYIGKLENKNISIAWLVICSFFFYGWWNPKYLLLIGFSLVFNYFIGKLLRFVSNAKKKKFLLIIGVITNIGLLCYYKYLNFFIENINYLLDDHLYINSIILPLAISFFTFEQVAYIIDVKRGNVKDYNFVEYCIFVIFFPQLIAGPIVHHNEIIPQIEKKDAFNLKFENIVIGITIFTIGLFKKVVLADGIAGYATPVFSAADEGQIISLFEAWGGALAYTFQLYFDFSGYSDMAIGLGRLFGIKLPLNFNSPYKAINIIEFWRRWHMTLSRFLRDYLYISLGGNRKGKIRRHVNLIITMLLGGIWHGAGWTFVLWGMLHGIYLIINYTWKGLVNFMGWGGRKTIFWRWISITLTFFSVVIGWVFFRAETLNGAFIIIKGMVGIQGIQLGPQYLNYFGFFGPILQGWGWNFDSVPALFWGRTEIISLVGLSFIVWILPNTQQFMRNFKPAVDFDPAQNLVTRYLQWIRWEPSRRWATLFAFFTVLTVLFLERKSEFLYFQF